MIPLDLQVNGFVGVDFNADGLSADALSKACRALREKGTGEILATVITADIDAMCRRLRAIADLRSRDAEVARLIVGIHIEGPFLNERPGYVGAHPAHAVRPADTGDMERLVDAAGGLTRLVTLAPERDPGYRTTRWLADRGIVVSAGHCDPSLDQLRAAIDEGLSMFTHLGNGCPLELHRHDNVIQRVLSLRDHLWICCIADGVHVPFPTLSNYLRAAGIERAIVVTDAIAAAGLGPGTYTLGDQEICIGEDLIAQAPDRSHFIGSTVTMERTLANLHDELGLAPREVEDLVCRNPRKALGIGQHA